MSEKIEASESGNSGFDEAGYWEDVTAAAERRAEGVRTYGATYETSSNEGGGFPLPGYLQKKFGYDEYGATVTPLHDHIEPERER